jgi:hypothetical protein
MRVDVHFWWQVVSSAASATLIDLGSKRPFWLFLITVFSAVVAFRAYRAPENKRWAVIRNQWKSEIRDVFIVIFSVGAVVFGYEFLWNQPNQIRLQQVEHSLSNPSTLFNRIPTVFPPISAQPMFFPLMAAAPSVLRFFCLKGFKVGAMRYLLNRCRLHHPLYTTTAHSSAEALTIQSRIAQSW